MKGWKDGREGGREGGRECGREVGSERGREGRREKEEQKEKERKKERKRERKKKNRDCKRKNETHRDNIACTYYFSFLRAYNRLNVKLTAKIADFVGCERSEEEMWTGTKELTGTTPPPPPPPRAR